MTDLNENEQWEAIKTWWKENARMVITTVLIVAVATMGFKYWQNTQRQKSQTASILYDQLLNNVFSAQHSDIVLAKIATDLEQNYTKTPYASDAALFEADSAVNQGNLILAQEKLNWVIDHAKDSNLRQIAKLRLARVLLAQKQPDKAMELLSSIENETYLPAINIVMGDIYLAKGDQKMARKSYQDAFDALPETQPIRQYLRIQMDQLL